jgi:hypothetical protein
MSLQSSARYSYLKPNFKGLRLQSPTAVGSDDVKLLQLLIVLMVVMVFLARKHKDHALEFLLSFMNFEALIFAEARAMPKFRQD